MALTTLAAALGTGSSAIAFHPCISRLTGMCYVHIVSGHLDYSLHFRMITCLIFVVCIPSLVLVYFIFCCDLFVLICSHQRCSAKTQQLLFFVGTIRRNRKQFPKELSEATSTLKDRSIQNIMYSMKEELPMYF